MLEKGGRLKDEDEVYCLVLKDYGVQVDYRGEDELNCLVSKVDYQGEDEVQTPEPSWVAMLIEVFALRGIIFPPFCSTTSFKSQELLMMDAHQGG